VEVHRAGRNSAAEPYEQLSALHRRLLSSVVKIDCQLLVPQPLRFGYTVVVGMP
jgi:hypothetical protein